MIPHGYCHCGCGQKTRLAPKTITARGWKKGEPIFYIHNHHRPRTKPDRYDIVDTGYDTPCWIWKLTPTTNGYAQVRINNKGLRAHRVAYEEKFGPIPHGLVIDHLCRQPMCVNPDHLEAVTQGENIRRGWKRTRHPERGR